MSEYNDLLADAREDQFESERRGYSRRQVDEYVAWRNGQFRDLETNLTEALGQVEQLRVEVSEARQAVSRPAHEEVSERVGQILKLAADEAKSDRDRSAVEIGELRAAAKQETDKIRADTKRDTDKIRAEAQNQAERMLSAAQEQSERSVAAAMTEAEQLTSAAQAEAERAVTEATTHADSTVAAAIAQAKLQLDEATARATAIHDGAERRLNLLISRHTETVRRLTEIRDVVTSLVSGEAARGSLEDEVARALGGTGAANGGAEGRPGGHQADPLQGGGHRTTQRPAGQPDGRHSAAAPAAASADAALAQPVPAGRQAGSGPTARTGSAGQAASRDGDRPDPLTGSRRDSGRYPAREADAAAHPMDGARHPADSLRHSADSLRNSTSVAGDPPREDGALDDTAATGLVIDN